MKKYCLYCLASLLIGHLQAQNVAINTDGSPADASAMLDVQSSTKGMLIPRTSTTTRMGMSAPAKGLMIYDTTTNSFWYHNGTAWTEIGRAANTGWAITGNANTDSTQNFIGTVDSVPLIFKVDNVRSGELNWSRNNTSFGYQAMLSNIPGKSNTALGANAMVYYPGGTGNTAVGVASLYGHQKAEPATSGNFNTAIGCGALKTDSTGADNTAVGVDALYLNWAGSTNTALGRGAGYNATGNANVFLGRNAGYFETGSDKLYISNSETASPLIGGDFNKGTVTINAVLNLTPSAMPTSYSAGTIYFDNALSRLRYYDGTSWHDL